MTESSKSSIKRANTEAAPSRSVQWSWPDSVDAVRAVPESHKVLIENEEVWVLEFLAFKRDGILSTHQPLACVLK